MNPYLKDILCQPDALQSALEKYPAEQLEPLRSRLQKGVFDRIVLTGMGSSLNAGYPAWLDLLSLPVPVIYVNTAELLHYGQTLIGARTLLWINSQSGRSVEVLRLLDSIKGSRPAFQLSMSNDLDSPMALSADLAVPIHAGEEATVSTKTYINMLAVLLLASSQLTGGDWQALRSSMRDAADLMKVYLADWQARVEELDALLGAVDQLLILGRGASMAAVWNGSLINKEAAKCAFEGMNAADFRHGPLELASPRLTAIVLEGPPKTASLNRELALEIIRLGGKAIWLASRREENLPTLCLPGVYETALPLVEILPLQMLTLAMARRSGCEPGQFRHVGKITTQE